MKRTKLLIIYGGQSSEHEVSLVSAKAIYEAMDSDKYERSLIKITKDGRWLFVGSITTSDIGVEVKIDASNRSFELADGTLIAPDVVFPALHGKYGEDGTIQGLLEMMHLPYVGCGVEASALCMDKVRAKRLLLQAGIAVVPSICVSKHQKFSPKDVLGEVGVGPWFVKPSRAGSSVGVTKVYKFGGLLDAAEEAFKHDDDILIEQAITGHEIEVAVLGNSSDIIVSQPGEIIPGEDFYSYDDKYADDSDSQVSYELPESIAGYVEAIRQLAEQSYRTLGCAGLSRVDFFVTDAGKVYVNEINTMPGFTDISMYPKLMERAGYGAVELVDKLISLALE